MAINMTIDVDLKAKKANVQAKFDAELTDVTDFARAIAESKEKLVTKLIVNEVERLAKMSTAELAEEHYYKCNPDSQERALAEKLLSRALRQYKHNDGSDGYVFGYDREEALALVIHLTSLIRASHKQLIKIDDVDYSRTLLCSDNIKVLKGR